MWENSFKIIRVNCQENQKTFLTFAIFMTRIGAVSKTYQYLLKFGVGTLYTSSLNLSLRCALCFFCVLN